MTELEPATAVEAGAVTNESGSPRLQKCNLVDFKKEGVVNNGEQEERELEGEKNDLKEDIEEVENGGNLNEEKKSGTVNTAEISDITMSGTEDAKLSGTKGGKVKDITTLSAEGGITEDMKADKCPNSEEMKIQGVEEAEAAKAENAKDLILDVKGEISKEASTKDVEREGVEDIKDNSKDVKLEDVDKRNSTDVDGKDVEGAAVKIMNAESDKKEDSKDVKMVDDGDVNNENGVQGKNVEEKAKHEESIDAKQKAETESSDKKANVDENKMSRKKRSRGQKENQKGEGKEGKDDRNKAKLNSPVASPTIERPVRERKTVERLVEVIEKEPTKEFQVEKGRGTPLKDIPNVAYKITRKKPMDHLKLIHQILFGRKGKAINVKSHILQFSGFVWHESDEKQRAKMKEKLDKHVKDTILDLCDVFDISVSRTNSRKEDLISKLLDFLISPHATTDVLLSEKEQLSAKTKKRNRAAKGSASKTKEDTPVKPSRKKQSKSEDRPVAQGSSYEKSEEGEDEEGQNTDDDVSDEDVAHEHSGSDSDKSDKEDKGDGENLGKGKPSKGKTSKGTSSASNEKSKVSSSVKKTGSNMKSPSSASKSPKTPSSKRVKIVENSTSGAPRNKTSLSIKSPSSTAKSPKTPTSKRMKNEEDNGSGASKNETSLAVKSPSSSAKSPKTPSSKCVKMEKDNGSGASRKKRSVKIEEDNGSGLSRKRKSAKIEEDNGSGSSKKKKSADSNKKQSTPKSDTKEKDSGKKLAKGKSKAMESETPSKEDLRTKICELLKKVDFNTATFTDILKQLASHFKTDLTPRKASVKLMIQEELTKMAEEDQENEDDTSDEEDEPKPTGKKVKA